MGYHRNSHTIPSSVCKKVAASDTCWFISWSAIWPLFDVGETGKKQLMKASETIELSGFLMEMNFYLHVDSYYLGQQFGHCSMLKGLEKTWIELSETIKWLSGFLIEMNFYLHYRRWLFVELSSCSMHADIDWAAGASSWLMVLDYCFHSTHSDDAHWWASPRTLTEAYISSYFECIPWRL